MDELIFVYNADSGAINALIDHAHKTLSPDTYECNLCAITYGNLGMKKDWGNFIKSLQIESRFLHKNELAKEFPSHKEVALPAVFLQHNKKLSELISAKEINEQKNIKDLKSLVLEKLPK